MTKTKLDAMSVSELVSRFAEIGIAQDQALEYDELAKFNSLFEQMQAVSQELKRRPDDQRQALMALYEHPNMQVRVKAAKHTLAVAPQAAREALEAIRAFRWQPQAGEAGISLWNLDRGVFKPT